MGHWGVKSYELDEANDALDAGFERVHGTVYEEMMDDGNPLTFEEVQQKLAGPETLASSLEALGEELGTDYDAYDEIGRLAYAGVIVRHAELKVPVPEEARARALAWLEAEEIDWEETTKRQLRRDREMNLLRTLRG